MFQFNVPIVNACLWMRDDHAHVMQVKLCKANTRGVTLATSKLSIGFAVFFTRAINLQNTPADSSVQRKLKRQQVQATKQVPQQTR